MRSQPIPILVAFTAMLAAPAAMAQESAAEPKPTEATAVTVDNELSTPVRVYLEHDDIDMRLGVVAAGDNASFMIPSWLVQDGEEVQLFVNPGKGFEESTGLIPLEPSEHLEVVVPAAGKPNGHRASTPAPAWNAPTTVTVQNNLSERAKIYVERGMFDVKLGSVPAGGSMVFDLPSWILNGDDAVSVYARTKHGLEQTTGILEVHRGERLGVVIPRR